ncbi:formate dehydrogenase subunit delta [Sphingomonas sp.]|uniref:formate dehydrogenase subunit delta n=1 Tax=Sphingomonas sp. TaxID=28214 RepID=UPI002DBC7D76|nr:formate dehydrogenase subunit delta [Sphingomonas sp.]HEU4968944.1 formate dehydrogenase subunit delta [Sphingomonas sp.]
MSTSLDRLIYMANQIARNLATDADPVAATAHHIRRFWDPRMRAMILDHLTAGGQGLDPVARDALLAMQGSA